LIYSWKLALCRIPGASESDSIPRCNERAGSPLRRGEEEEDRGERAKKNTITIIITKRSPISCSMRNEGTRGPSASLEDILDTDGSADSSQQGAKCRGTWPTATWKITAAVLDGTMSNVTDSDAGPRQVTGQFIARD